MASIVKQPNGRRRIDVFVNGKRRRVRLGKISQKDADAYKVKIDALAFAVNHDTNPDNETAAWLEARDATMRARLELAGLVPASMRKPLRTLGEFLTEYFATIKVKPGTLTMLQQTRDNLLTFFTKEKAMSLIGPLDADRFEVWLREGSGARRQGRRNEEDKRLAGATVSRRLRIARQMFGRAGTWGLVRANPFTHIKSGGEVNQDRLFFVARDATDKLLEHCPDVQWRVIVALSRYAGMRCPSEHLALRWDDVLWSEKKMIVRAAKTEHHKGKATRIIPLFPEVEAVLYEARDQAAEGEPFVITRYRDPKQNLRTTFLKILHRAGLLPWPRLFQNMRSSRETELVETFPIQVACAWIGNSETVAKKHYLQVTEDHYRIATQGAQSGAQSTADNGGQPRTTDMHDDENAKKAAFSGHDDGREEARPAQSDPVKPHKSSVCTASGGALKGAPRESATGITVERMRWARRVMRAAEREAALGLATRRDWGRP